MHEKRAAPKTPDTPVVYIIDDDPSMQDALSDLFQSVKIEARCFDSARAFLDGFGLGRPGCLLLDVRLPGLSGLDFQVALEKMGADIPIVFMTGHGDVPMSVRAMKAGAIDFLIKPFRDQDVLDAVAVALNIDAERRQEKAAGEEIHALVETLTSREREVMNAVVRGLMNKQIAHELGIAEITVKLHRGNVMRKMQVRSVAELVRKVGSVG